MDTENDGSTKSLLEWAQRLCPDSPRKRIKEWIASGRFYLNGEVLTKAALQMQDPGEALTLGKPDSSTASWFHRKRIHSKLVVLHLDASLAIIDKSAGLLSVPMDGGPGDSALDILANYLNDSRGDVMRRRLFGSTAKVRPLPVHRLDQYTSGLFCVALNTDSRNALISQLRSRELLREYIAYADGEPATPSGIWHHFLKLDETGYRQSLYKEPKEGTAEAITHYTVEKIFAKHHITRLKIRLETGLKHQIRIQAAAEGMPLIGDQVYHEATRKAVERKGALPYGLQRQALHAAVIGLKHPLDGQPLRFESHIPGDLQKLEERISS